MKLSSRTALLCIILSLSLTTPAHAWQSAESVVAAMDIDMSLILNGSIATPNGPSTQPGPPDDRMFDVRTSLGVVSPYNAPTMGLLFTGNVDTITNYTGAYGDDHDYLDDGQDSGDYVTLTFDIEVPVYANSFSFNFNFLSREFPEWVSSTFNDTFEVFLSSNAFEGQIVFDAFGNEVTVNNALFQTYDSSQLQGTGFCEDDSSSSFIHCSDTNGDGNINMNDSSCDCDGSTGWVTTIAPCDPGEIMTISFEIYDVADGILDSGVLLDNFSFSEQEVPDGPWTGDDTPDEPLMLAYVSPKEGDLDGGVEVTLNGKNFSHDTSVYWDGMLIDTANTVVETGGDRLRIENIPAAQDSNGDGLLDGSPVDIRLVRGSDEEILISGYTYWDFSGGSAPPMVLAVGPDTAANPSGGALIRVRGTGFANDAQVLFIDADGELSGENTATLEGGEEIQVNVPPHADGWVDLVVENPDGLRSTPGYPFQYSSGAAPAPSAPSSLDGDRAGTGCSVSGPAPNRAWLLLLLFGSLLALRQREGA